MTDILVGDDVLVQGKVLQIEPRTGGVLVEFFSKTDQYGGWVRPDLVTVVHPDAPVEPPDGTWLTGAGGSDEASVFRRDDAASPEQGGRRLRQRWWDYAGQAWVDWPAAVRRGADPAMRLMTQFADPRREAVRG